jgi:hypothetical protein
MPSLKINNFNTNFILLKQLNFHWFPIARHKNSRKNLILGNIKFRDHPKGLGVNKFP